MEDRQPFEPSSSPQRNPAPIQFLVGATGVLSIALMFVALWEPLASEMWTAVALGKLGLVALLLLAIIAWLGRRGFLAASLAMTSALGLGAGVLATLTRESPEPATSYGALALSALGLIGVILLAKASRHALAVVLTTWLLAIGPLIGMVANPAAYFTDTTDRPVLAFGPAFFRMDALLLILIAAQFLTCLLALFAGQKVARWVICGSAARHWLGMPAAEASSSPAVHRAASRPGASVVLGSLVFALWFGLVFTIESLFWSLPDLSIESITQSVFFTLSLPFVVAAGLVLWRATERIAIENGGIRIYLLHKQFTVLFISWQSLYEVREIAHKRQPASFVLLYRSHLGIPLRLGVHPARYERPSELIESLRERFAQPGWSYRAHVSPDALPHVAWSLVVLGSAFAFGQVAYSGWMMHQIALDRVPLSDFHSYAGALSLPLLNWAAIACFGLALGLMSAHHRGGFRPGLMSLWVVGSTLIPGPLLHWLVWIAMYAILTARLAPIQPHEWIPVPSAMQWEIGFWMADLVPVVAGLSYVLGVVLGHRPLRPAASLAPSPTPAPQPAETAAPQRVSNSSLAAPVK